MRWFLVKIVFQIRTGESDPNHQFDESFRLLEADDIADAYKKAYNIGQIEQSSFFNVHNETIEWRFIDVPDVIDLGQLKDGVEVFALTGEEKSPEEYIGSIQTKVTEMRKSLVKN